MLLLLVKVATIIEVNALTDGIEGVVVPVRFKHETPLALIESPRKARTLLIPRKSRSISAFSVFFPAEAIADQMGHSFDFIVILNGRRNAHCPRPFSHTVVLDKAIGRLFVFEFLPLAGDILMQMGRTP